MLPNTCIVSTTARANNTGLYCFRSVYAKVCRVPAEWKPQTAQLVEAAVWLLLLDASLWLHDTQCN